MGLKKITGNSCVAFKYSILMLFILLNSFCSLKAQLSEDSRISILTCEPGDELYSTFGHTAIRVVDSENNLDMIFNYGTFDFNTQYFYFKFAKGELNYKLSANNFEDFLFEYSLDERSVWEQILNLNQNEKSRLFAALIENAKPENRDYKYHFFFDNCATRVRDMVANNTDGGITFKEPDYVGTMTFRTAIATYLEKSHWTKFGLDLILGKPTDDWVDKESVQFLPDYLMGQFATAILKNSENSPVVSENKTVIKFDKYNKKSIFTPFIILSIICFFVILISRFNFRKKKTSRWLDILIFSVVGLLGMLILFLWFFTSHTVTALNWNILWANPLLLIFVFMKSYNGFYKYFTLLILAMQIVCIVVFTFTGNVFGQYIPLALIPVWIILLMRLFMRFSEVRHLSIMKIRSL